MELLPHQIALVEAFFDLQSKRNILLRADVGLGKTIALVALVARLLRQRPFAKVLLLAPGSLRVQLAELLRNAGVPALTVDRYRFRELSETAIGGELWPRGAVSLLGREFARQEDIGQALCATRWDLLIVDEAHQFRGPLDASVVCQVADVSDRVILGAAVRSDLPMGITNDDTTVVQWRRDQVVDFNGERLDSTPRPAVFFVSFALSAAELGLADAVGELCKLFQAGTKQHLIAISLRRSLRSSPAALEGSLTRIREARNRAAHFIHPSPESLPDAEFEDRPDEPVDFGIIVKAAEMASRALDALEAAGADSKLAALSVLLNQIDALKISPTRICVVAEYVNTLFYLCSEIESRGQSPNIFYGGMATAERHHTLAKFSDEAGILAATRAAITEGVTLTQVTDLVLYDTPDTLAELQQLLSRFDRFGRDIRLNIHFLEPSNGLDESRVGARDRLRQAIGPTELAQDE